MGAIDNLLNNQYSIFLGVNRIQKCSMTFIKCVVGSSHNNSTLWQVCYGVLFGYFFVLFLYGLVPIIRFYRPFARFAFMNRATRISITVALFIKSMFHLGVLIIGVVNTQFFSADSPMETLWGLILLDFPTYLVSTCYTLVLLFWLLICLQLLPMRYSGTFTRMKVVLLAYNIAIYLIYFASMAALLISRTASAAPRSAAYIMGIGECARDMVLCAIFAVFYVFLKLGLSQVDAARSAAEKQLLRFTIVLMVMLVARGLLPLFHRLIFLSQFTECSKWLCAWQFLVGFVCDGLPLWWLIYVNNQFLLDSAAMGLDPNQLTTGIHSMPNE
jgi:hypothetical protein